MRDKEIDEAMELLEKIKINESLNLYINLKDVKRADVLLKYIEELEDKEK